MTVEGMGEVGVVPVGGVEFEEVVDGVEDGEGEEDEEERGKGEGEGVQHCGEREGV